MFRNTCPTARVVHVCVHNGSGENVWDFCCCFFFFFGLILCQRKCIATCVVHEYVYKGSGEISWAPVIFVCMIVC